MSSSSSSESLPNNKFTNTYICNPIVRDDGNRNLERGGNLQLPPSALHRIVALEIPYPLMFKVTNDSNNHFTHAGVIEFIAEEGQVNVPVWIMNSLHLKPQDKVTITSVSLPAATYCKIQPLTNNFENISDIETVLEQNLKFHFACLTEGDILSITESGKNEIYKIKIVETKPESAVNILDCEVELEIAMPEKPKEPIRGKMSEKVLTPYKAIRPTIKPCFKAFQGQGFRLGSANEESSENKEVQETQNKGSSSEEIESSSKGEKRKCEDDSGEQQNKRICAENDDDDDNDSPINEIVFIRKNINEEEPNGENS